jgi:2-C-methyl-D-erythritol 4-phosphate cytidylyltransferase/2-C-methyl-D-erythritol 2,4-cyclodiphosphate synthase
MDGHPMPTTALIVAAGRGLRLDPHRPKQYCPVLGKPMLCHSIDVFSRHPQINAIQVVIHGEDRQAYEAAITLCDPAKLLPPVIGGKERQDSVRLGLLALEKPDYVLIHDAARPFLSLGLIDALLDVMKEHKAVIPVLPVTDTLRRIGQGSQTVARDNLFSVQTPQAFEYGYIRDLHQRFEAEKVTDDAALVELAGDAVHAVRGERANIKITTIEDLAMLPKHPRTAMGFDVHRFSEASAETIMLGGVAVPHDKAIEAHSDGDVVLHALVDALLGSISAGDIGKHFPPSDPEWKNADSTMFLRHARKLVEEAGGKILHTDTTIICERPKIRPYAEAMQKHIASVLELPLNAVSIKATTTEKLGFTGRGEGIAAQSLVTVVC